MPSGITFVYFLPDYPSRVVKFDMSEMHKVKGGGIAIGTERNANTFKNNPRKLFNHISGSVGNADGNKFVDVKSYLFEQRVYLSSTPYKLYGFNSHDTSQDWNGNLVTESFTGDDNSWLICFSGNPTINGVEMEELDYAKLT